MYKSNMQAARHVAIQAYNLFGERGDLPDIVHCETIAARSALHGWVIAPHRHARLHQILLIESGGGEATIEGRSFRLGAMRFVNVPIGSVHGFRFVPGMQGWVVTIAAEMLDEVLLPVEGLGPVLGEPAVARASAAMRATMRQIFAEYAGREFARAHLLRAQAGMLFGLVARALADRGARRDRATRRDLLDRFQALIDQHYRQHWTVSQYAAALSVTPTHLSRVARAATGHPASRMIVDRIVREARRNLVYTNLSISTIAYALGFKDPAYFSRVYATATGFSPRDFRDRVHATAS